MVLSPVDGIILISLGINLYPTTVRRRAENRGPLKNRISRCLAVVLALVGVSGPVFLWELHKMFRQSIRRFGTTALRAAEGSTAYGVRVSQAQGVVNGLTEGMRLTVSQVSCRSEEFRKAND